VAKSVLLSTKVVSFIVLHLVNMAVHKITIWSNNE